MSAISIVIPARNEETTIAEVVERSIEAFDAMGREGEVLVVNDGSSDGTGRVLADLAHRYPNLRLFTRRRSRGMTAALQTMFSAARGDIVILIPADMESDPLVDVPALIEHLEAHDLDAVAGWRQGRKDGKVVASGVYNWSMRWLAGVHVHDGNWIKAMRREVVNALPPLRSDWHRFLLMIAAHQGFRIGEVQTFYQPRPAGRSNFGVWRIPISLLDAITLKFLLVFSQKPMRFFGGIGLAGLVVSGLILLGLTIYYFGFQTQVRPLFFSALTLAVISVLLVLVGFLAELIVTQGERINELERELSRGEREKLQ